MTDGNFWETKALADMNAEEWESLCDGCGRCCLHKLEDIDSGNIAFTNVACHLLDQGSCRCTRYDQRQRLVPDCLVLTPEHIDTLSWMPRTCAYRLLAEGQPLAWWHPLVSGDPQTVHEAGISVRDRVVSETEAGDFEDYVVDWPAE